jgi:hypothetical protein
VPNLKRESAGAGNTKGGSIALPLTSCLTGLNLSVSQIKTKIVSCHTANSKPVKQEVNCTVILPPLVFPGWGMLKITNLRHSYLNIMPLESSGPMEEC